MELLDFNLINKLICNNSLITLSWGIHNLLLTQNEVSFNVNGLKFCGKVSIKSMGENLFSVSLSNETTQYNFLSTITDMIGKIDTIIEFDDDYANAISKK